MDQKELVKIRGYLGKSQRQLAQLLSISLRALQSFEQGWRNVPVHVERQMLFFLATKEVRSKKRAPCWKIIKCPPKVKANCPAWEFKVGHLCWFIGGTICHGEEQVDWHDKIQACRQCRVFKNLFTLLKN